MKLAILFWFYKDAAICRNRLKLLRRYNPDTPIFGLYGGDPAQAATFQSALACYLDDFFVYPEAKDNEWKWFNGDLVITKWYRRRGHLLSWDTIVVVQWDMLIFGKLAEVFSELKEGELLLSSLRPVEEVANWWEWVTQHKQRYEAFVEHLKREHGYDGPAYCCQFVVACLPRRFCEQYSVIRNPELGFIEYRLPTYARVFGIPFCGSRTFDCWWPADPATKHLFKHHRPLSAAGVRLPYRVLFSHLLRPRGARVFHPFFKTVPLDARSTLEFLVDLLKYNKIQSGRTMKSIKRFLGRPTLPSTR